MGSWLLVRRVGDVDIAFKFAKSVKIPANETITVWSSGENKKHEPPFNIVMKNQKWATGDVMETVLQNKDGEVFGIFFFKWYVKSCTFNLFVSTLIGRCFHDSQERKTYQNAFIRSPFVWFWLSSG